MKQNELRIGNHVWGISDRIEQVNEILTAYVETSFRGGILHYSNYEDISPIELTPEILEKSRFEFGVNDNGTYYTNLNNIDRQLEIVLSGNEFYPQLVQAPEMSNEDCQIVSLNSIQYVHQLQNLYYALSGEELEIKF